MNILTQQSVKAMVTRTMCANPARLRATAQVDTTSTAQDVLVTFALMTPVKHALALVTVQLDSTTTATNVQVLVPSTTHVRLVHRQGAAQAAFITMHLHVMGRRQQRIHPVSSVSRVVRKMNTLQRNVMGRRHQMSHVLLAWVPVWLANT